MTINRDSTGSGNRDRDYPGDRRMASFDRAAGRYDRFSPVQRAMADWTAKWLPAGPEAGAIREMAAGTGHLTRYLRGLSTDIVASDASRAMVETGSRTLPEITWKIRRAEDVPNFPADWILSSSFLQWVRDPQRLFHAWNRSLAPNGRVLAGLFVRPTLTELEELLPEAIPLSWKTPVEWREILSESGFRLLRDESASREFHFASAMDFFRSLHYVGAAPRRRLSSTEMRKLIRSYSESYGSSEGVRSTWTFYRFEAERCRTAAPPS